MPETRPDAFLDDAPRVFDALVDLYDRFAHSDALDPEADRAEKTFNAELLSWYDGLTVRKVVNLDFHQFRKAVIVRCKQRIIKERLKPKSI